MSHMWNKDWPGHEVNIFRLDFEIKKKKKMILVVFSLIVKLHFKSYSLKDVTN